MEWLKVKALSSSLSIAKKEEKILEGTPLSTGFKLTSVHHGPTLGLCLTFGLHVD
jgi:hypothetical protein